ncbi:MAG: Lar family restriction alleviation protein [Actinomycetota bacterium]
MTLEAARETLGTHCAWASGLLPREAWVGEQKAAQIAAAIDVVLNAVAAQAKEIDQLRELLAERPAPERAVDVVDESGRKIGHATVTGAQVIGRITDEHAAAVLRASTGPRGVSVGYRVEVVAEPTAPAPAVTDDSAASALAKTQATLSRAGERIATNPPPDQGPELGQPWAQPAPAADPPESARLTAARQPFVPMPLPTSQTSGTARPGARFDLVAEMHERARACPLEPAPDHEHGTRVRAGGFVGTVMPRLPGDNPGWSRVRLDDPPHATLGFQSRDLAPIPPAPVVDSFDPPMLRCNATHETDAGGMVVCNLRRGHGAAHWSPAGAGHRWGAHPLAPPSAHGTPIPPDALVAEMLPCPFCGKADPVVDRHPWTGRDPRCVQCQRCGAFGPCSITDTGPSADREATAHWNRRKDVPALQALDAFRKIAEAKGIPVEMMTGHSTDRRADEPKRCDCAECRGRESAEAKRAAVERASAIRLTSERLLEERVALALRWQQVERDMAQFAGMAPGMGLGAVVEVAPDVAAVEIEAPPPRVVDLDHLERDAREAMETDYALGDHWTPGEAVTLALIARIRDLERVADEAIVYWASLSPLDVGRIRQLREILDKGAMIR